MYSNDGSRWTNSANSSPAVHKVTYLWTIENFDILEHQGNAVDSPSFLASTTNYVQWFIRIKPNGETDAEDTIGLYLGLSDRSVNGMVTAKYSFSIFNQQQKKIISRESSIRKFHTGKTRGWKEFCQKDDTFREKLLPNNELKISCEVIFFAGGHLSIDHHFCSSADFLKSAIAGCDVTEDLDTLLKNHLYADFVISVNGKDFPVHKAILAARCKVFASLFEHEMKEHPMKAFEIENMSEEIVGEMLRFIYTGKCEKLNQLAEGLLEAADKYLLDRLKSICCEALGKNLTATNAVQNLMLADKYNASELKTDVLRFITSKPSEVMDSADWKKILTNLKLCDEVFRAMAAKLE